MKGLSARQRRQVLEHLEASEAAAHLVTISTTEQLRDLIAGEIAKETARRGAPSTKRTPKRSGGNLGLVLAALGQLADNTLGLRPHPGQVAVAAALCEGHLVEYPTGEGKTLAAALAAVWLAGVHGSCHIATANNYLAETGEKKMRPLFEAAGVATAVAHDGTGTESRRSAYQNPVVYSTLSTLATDYLSDQLATRANHGSRGRTRALIVDEADALLVDNATSPFTLAGTARLPVKLQRYTEIASSMEPGVHFDVDESRRTLWLTDTGVTFAQQHLGIDDLFSQPTHAQWLHAALMVSGGTNPDDPRRLIRAGVHYLFDDGEIKVIDQQGRAHTDRRLVGGLHPALETHLGLTPSKLPVPVARISTRGFVSRYQHLCGTAGTLMSDRDELRAVYGKDVLDIGPTVPSRRVDHPDRVYATRDAKHAAIVAEIERRHGRSQPVLVGTTTIDDAEDLSSRLHAAGIAHNLLTARDHQHEADLIAEAGKLASVTVTAKRAGRGVDIRLGGSGGEERDAVVDAGGLVVIATERFDSRRADRQLRGRCARQGDPGESLTFVSCEDDLVRVFAGEKLDAVLATVRADNHEDLRVPGLGALIDRAQAQVEQLNADLRMSLLAADDLRTVQTEDFYTWRASLAQRRDLEQFILSLYRRSVPDTRLSRRRARRRVRRNEQPFGSLWPSGRPVPGSTDRSMPDLLAEETWTDLRRRLFGDDSGLTAEERQSRFDATSDAFVTALLEIADAEWSSYLATLTALESASPAAAGNAPGVNPSLELAYSTFQQRVAERMLQAIWRASFSVRTA